MSGLIFTQNKTDKNSFENYVTQRELHNDIKKKRHISKLRVTTYFDKRTSDVP